MSEKVRISQNPVGETEPLMVCFMVSKYVYTIHIVHTIIRNTTTVEMSSQAVSVLSFLLSRLQA